MGPFLSLPGLGCAFLNETLSIYLKYKLNITSWESGTYEFGNLGSSKKIVTYLLKDQ